MRSAALALATCDPRTTAAEPVSTRVNPRLPNTPLDASPVFEMIKGRTQRLSNGNLRIQCEIVWNCADGRGEVIVPLGEQPIVCRRLQTLTGGPVPVEDLPRSMAARVPEARDAIHLVCASGARAYQIWTESTGERVVYAAIQGRWHALPPQDPSTGG